MILLKEVYNYLEGLLIDSSEKIVVAVSYGPDSMALLDILKNKYSASNIICAHVHHNHRKESDIEASMLEKYCISNNIIFEMMKIKKYSNDKFTEAEAREKRYEFFESLIKKYNSKYLFTAHHGDDLIETVLMRLTRGSSINGYYGISLISERDSYNIIRPLLFVTKDDILKYCSVNHINYAVDKSNSCDKYTRNRYRKYILPVLKAENKNVHKQFIKFSNELKEYDDYFQNLTDKIYKKLNKNGIINIKELLKNDNLVIRRIIMKFLFDYYGSDINKVNNTHVNIILKFLKSSKTNGIISLPNKSNLIKSYNYLFISSGNGCDNYCYAIEDCVLLPNNHIIKTVSNLENTTNYFTALDSREIKLPIFVRNKKTGDTIKVLGLNGTKKVKDIFIDEKVPINVRKGYPIVVDALDNILWIPGLKKSKYDKSKQGKYDIILKYQKEEKNDKTK